MAISDIKPGYMGIASVDGVIVRFSDASVHPAQDVQIPDLAQGTANHHAWHWGGITATGSLGGPLSCTTGDSMWSWGYNRVGDCEQTEQRELAIAYTCGEGFTFPEAHVATITISASAGDVANFSIDILGTSFTPGDPSIDPGGQDPLVTWDQCSFSGPGVIGEVQAFEMTVENNPEPAYIINAADLFPAVIIAGPRTVRASVTQYGLGTGGGSDVGCTEPGGAVNFTAGLISGTMTFTAQQRVEPKGGTGLFLSTVNYVGIGELPLTA